MLTTLCDYCHDPITDRTAGPEGMIEFKHFADEDRSPAWVSDTIHLHRTCLEIMRSAEPPARKGK